MSQQIVEFSFAVKVSLTLVCLVIGAMVMYLALACVLNFFGKSEKNDQNCEDDNWSQNMSFAKDD